MIQRETGRSTFPVSFSDSDYSPGLSQVLVEQKGAFQGTDSRVAIPYSYGQPSSSTRVVLLAPLRNLFNGLMMKRKLVATLPQLPSAQCEQGLYRPT